jgi:hypothetical protein
MWVRDVLIKWLLVGLVASTGIGLIVVIILELRTFWDKDKQAPWDKAVGTLVVNAVPAAQRSLVMDAAAVSSPAPALVAGASGTTAVIPPPEAAVALPSGGGREPASGETIAEGLRRLARLRDEGLITQDEFEEKRRRLVERL